MPDLDIIDRQVLPGWRAASRLLKGRDDPLLFAKAASKAMAKSIREHGGVPVAGRWIEIIEDRISGRVDAHSSFTRVGALEHQLGHSRHAKVAAKAARRLLVAIGKSRRPPIHARPSFFEAFCRVLLDHGFFDRINPYLPGKHFADRGEALERVGACRQALEPLLLRSAEQLMEQPDGRAFRAPPLRLPFRPTTEDLLHTPIM